MKPGVIAGGSIAHDCPLSRSIGYFLEPLIMLAPFAKRPLQLTLKGITTDDHDLSVCVQPPSAPLELVRYICVDVNCVLGGFDPYRDVASLATFRNRGWFRITGTIVRLGAPWCNVKQCYNRSQNVGHHHWEAARSSSFAQLLSR